MMYEDYKLKFVIYDGEIHMGKVLFHRDLLPDNYDKSKVFGGGIFEIREEDTLVFKGESHDFGKFNQEMILSLPIVDNRLLSYKRVIE